MLRAFFSSWAATRRHLARDGHTHRDLYQAPARWSGIGPPGASPRVLACLAVLLLQACGGGGSPPGPAPDPGPPPVSCAGAPSTPLPGALPDPLVAQQWHLRNTGQSGGLAGEDMQVTDAWARLGEAGCGRGAGVTLALIDGGIDPAHPDLAANLRADLSFDYADLSASNRTHGTAVAGILAAVSDNGLGGTGIAPEAQLISYGIAFGTSRAGTDVVDALTRNLDRIDVYHNSWSSPDRAGALQKATSGFASAIERGLANGRAGRGALYVFAAGNGGVNGELSTYDGYLNHRGVIVACAVDHTGKRPKWAERGANLWVCGPSGPADDSAPVPSSAITTTAPEAAYDDHFDGSSASAPMVSGTAALILAANRDLSARDVRLILAHSARRNDADDIEWSPAAASGGRPYNPNYGFGVVDANAAVQLARTWQSVGDDRQIKRCEASAGRPFTQTPGWPIAIPDGSNAGIVSPLSIEGAHCAIESIEHVEVRLSLTHDYPGDVTIKLTSPSGSSSTLALARDCGKRNSPVAPDCGEYDVNWPIAVTRHLDEMALGTWQLSVTDPVVGKAGSLEGWSLRIWGR